MRERLTKVKVSKNIRLAAEPTTWMGKINAMANKIPPVAKMAM